LKKNKNCVKIFSTPIIHTYKGLFMRLFYLSSLIAITVVANAAYGDKFEKATTSVKPAVSNATTATTTNATAKKISIKEATINAINALRASNQTCAKATTPLIWNEALYNVTKEHTIDMAANNILKHDGSGTKTDITAKRLGLNRGSHFFERVNQKVNSKAILSGELIVSVTKGSYVSPKSVLNYWINRPNDCKVIMDPRFSDVALSKVINTKTGRAYWTLMLAGRGKK